MKMNKILTVSCGLLGLAMACVPAYAGPTRKKITIDCSNVTAPHYITGDATITFCAASSNGTCGGATADCPSTPIPIACDSRGGTDPISVTVPCDVQFKVKFVTGHANVKEFDAAGNLIATGGSLIDSTLGGKGYSVLYPASSPGTGAVALTIK